MAFSISPTTGFDIQSSLSPSEQINAAKYFVPTGAAAPTLWDTASNLSLSIEDTFGPNAPDIGSILGLDSSQFLGGLAGSSQGWTFITAPEDVSWDVANQATRVDIFGTNNPPVVAGSRGMRDLTLSNSLVEGFSRYTPKNVEAKVAALEALMNYGLNTSDGFVSVPVYQVWANSKSYGGPEAYYIIKDVKVKETMRDIQGQSTRAYVDISLMQVPAYQVNSGRDQASQTTAGAGQILQAAQKQAAATGTNGATAAKGAAASVDAKNPAAATAAGRAGANAASPGAGTGLDAVKSTKANVRIKP